jgi:hypothetical protein
MRRNRISRRASSFKCKLDSFIDDTMARYEGYGVDRVMEALYNDLFDIVSDDMADIHTFEDHMVDHYEDVSETITGKAVLGMLDLDDSFLRKAVSARDFDHAAKQYNKGRFENEDIWNDAINIIVNGVLTMIKKDVEVRISEMEDDYVGRRASRPSSLSRRRRRNRDY